MCKVLGTRLQARGYNADKVQENLEAEAIDAILQEAIATGKPVVQRDATNRSPTQLLAAFDEPKTDTLKGTDLGPADWSNWLMENGAW